MNSNATNIHSLRTNCKKSFDEDIFSSLSHKSGSGDNSKCHCLSHGVNEITLLELSEIRARLRNVSMENERLRLMVTEERILREQREKKFIEAIGILRQAKQTLQSQLANAKRELQAQVKKQRLIFKYRKVIIELQTENRELKSLHSAKKPQKNSINEVSLSNLQDEILNLKTTLAQLN